MVVEDMSGASKSKAAGKDNCVTKELTVTNQLGIHARPASMFVKAASRYHSDVFVEKDGETVNGKSIMGMMMLAAGPGSKIRVRAEGNDAAQAITELESLLHRKFDEE
jgi:phosphocarrier protein HPr